MTDILIEHTSGVTQIVESTDGYDLEQWTVIGDPAEVVLTDAKSAARASVNTKAERVREQFLTPGAGQAMTYLRKEQEALAWSEGADPADFPFLAAECSTTGATMAELVAVVLAQANAWATVGAYIEGLRRGALVAIDNATTLEEIASATEVTWPSA